ncbi:PEPxxWA-CTERM sorting domain-containing protein [Glacieibacterium sp.]|uniref:PEPxxWA-CTERM sorting domain-containing protein n=1 Tax=Glacieibacterium sp. TaxID=2860237 RepID=UPI003AFF9287
MKITRIALALVALAGFTGSAAQAGVNLVQNGGFEMLTNGPGQFDNNTSATGWTSNGYNFIFGAGTADTSGVNGQYGNLKLWGPGNGSNNGFASVSPVGGNYVGADGAFLVAPIQQTINNLVVGAKYDVGFYWGGAQQFGYNGETTEQWKVSFGDQQIDTAVLTNASHGFTGWQKENFTFTATNVSQVLSFLAVGTPNGEPPFSLLDGVSVTAAVPEPATWAMMILGMGAVGAASRLRRRQAGLATA